MTLYCPEIASFRGCNEICHRLVLAKVNVVNTTLHLRPIVEICGQIYPKVKWLASHDDTLKDRTKRVKLFNRVPPSVMELGWCELFGFENNVRFAQMAEILVEDFFRAPDLVTRGRAGIRRQNKKLRNRNLRFLR